MLHSHHQVLSTSAPSQLSLIGSNQSVPSEQCLRFCLMSEYVYALSVLSMNVCHETSRRHLCNTVDLFPCLDYVLGVPAWSNGWSGGKLCSTQNNCWSTMLWPAWTPVKQLRLVVFDEDVRTFWIIGIIVGLFVIRLRATLFLFIRECTTTGSSLVI